MSAIAGMWCPDGRPDFAARCRRMLAAQEIYGPHDGSVWTGDAIAMGRRLFRILPEDVYDKGPVSTPDGRLTLVADVRLDNRDDLAPALGIPADRAARMSDAAILLAALARWQHNALDRIEGDFAFALWNDTAQTLLLARDFLGTRPLHFHRGRDFFAFASMPKGLHALPDVAYGPDEAAMAEFLALLPTQGDASFFRDVKRIEPGTFAVATRTGLTVTRYWNPQRPAERRRDARDYAAELRHHLDRATRVRLRGAKGAVAAHLSAGFDSSSVTATAARLLAPDGGKVVAFTAVPREGYDGKAPPGRMGDEGPLAAETAALYPNIEHVRIRSGHRSPLAGLDRNFFLFDRPVLNLCNSVWSQAINEEARARGLQVLLTAQLGNMSISYDAVEWLPELLRQGRLLTLLMVSARLVARRQKRFDGVLAQIFAPYLPASLWRAVNRLLRDRDWNIAEYSALRSDRLEAMGLAEIARERGLDFAYRPRKDSFASRLWVLGRVDLGNYHKGQLAGWGIDSRDPTADKRLMEFCLAVPLSEYLAGGIVRSLGKRALADRIPASVLTSSLKGLQAIDWHEGFAASQDLTVGELERLSACGPAADLIDVPHLQSLMQQMPEGGWHRSGVTSAYRLALLRGISAGHFIRRAHRSNT